MSGGRKLHLLSHEARMWLRGSAVGLVVGFLLAVLMFSTRGA